MHKGCAGFLKENHEPQDLSSVNYVGANGNGPNDALTADAMGQTGGAFANSAVACTNGTAGEYPCKNIDLMSFIPLVDFKLSGDFLTPNANDVRFTHMLVCYVMTPIELHRPNISHCRIVTVLLKCRSGVGLTRRIIKSMVSRRERIF